MKLKPGMMISFKKDIKAHIGRAIIVPAHKPVKVTKVNDHHIFFLKPNGEEHYVRYSEDKFYIATEMGRILYE